MLNARMTPRRPRALHRSGLRLRWPGPKVAAAILLFGCTDAAKQQAEANRKVVRQLVSDAPTHPETPLDIQFGDQIRLVGYDLTARRLTPGERITVTWHWQVLSPLAGGFHQGTQLAETLNGDRFDLDQSRVLEQVYPPKRWKKGQYLKDPQGFSLPPDWRAHHVHLLLAFSRGEERLEVKKGRHDDANRAVVTIPLLDESAPEKLAKLAARPRGGSITLDGRLEEPDWQAAPRSGPLVNTMHGSQGSFPAEVRVMYDSSAIYVAFEVQDADLRASMKKHDDHLWEQDTVEVMLDPDGDGRNYFEIQVSPRNVVFDTQYDRRRQPRPFGHVDWSSGVKAGVQVNGTLDDDKPDAGYTVEMRIPVGSLVVQDEASPAPAPGTLYRMNFFVMDRQERGQRAVGWSPPLVGDFHTLQRFGEIAFR